MTGLDDLPLELLAHLASRSEQVRYIVGGTASEYLVPEDLLNDAWHFCERATKPEIRNRLSAAQANSIEGLAAAIKRDGDVLDRYNRETIAALIDDPAWASLRRLAAETLLAFGQTPAD